MDSIPEKKKKKKKKNPPAKKPGEALFINPCTPKLTDNETVSKRSTKKRRVTQGEVVVLEKEKKEGHQVEVSYNKFKRGDHVDVEALLSSKARNFLVTSKGGEVVPIAGLARNYVIICCFYVPFDIDDPLAATCHSIEALYNELTFKGIADRVKLVVVAKIAPGFGKAEFDTFFSGLSVNCLAIPFADSKSRDKICKSFGLLTQVDDDSESPCLIVHPNGKVLQFNPYLLGDYGARSYPFTKEHIDEIVRQDEIIRNKLCSTDTPIFLEELLECDYLSQIPSENDYIPTSALSDKVVALYLCYDGGSMEMLQDIHQECFDKGFNFEVILVPLPFSHYYETPSFFHDRMKQDALKHPRSSSWWTFPFDDKVYRTLWRLFYHPCEDRFLILPHGRSPGDLCAKEIITNYGISAYPFTRDTLANKEVSELRSFTLQDLLGNIGMEPNLNNKNVLLYIDSPRCDWDGGQLYNILKQDYHNIKAKYADSELVFVSVIPHLGLKNSQISEMKWPILPLGICVSVIDRISPTDCPCVVAFGPDGKILSRFAHRRLPVSTSSASPFSDTLASEVASQLRMLIIMP